MIAAILETDPAPIRTAQPLAPPALDRVVSKCLAKDPEARWQTARDLVDELGWMQRGIRTPDVAGANETVGKRALEWTTTTVVVVALAFVTVVALAVALGAFFEGRFRGRQPETSCTTIPGITARGLDVRAWRQPLSFSFAGRIAARAGRDGARRGDSNLAAILVCL